MNLAPAKTRAAMCRIAVADDPAFEVSDVELLRSGPSYTIDTVLNFKAMGHADVAWLIGADMLQIFPTWHRATDLMREARILIMRRPGFLIDWKTLPPEFQSLQANVIDAPLMDISATDIRRRVRNGQPIDHLVPEGVARYIRENRLYQS